MNGDDGNDYLTGDDGNDTLQVGLESDTLTGGTGMDNFDFSSYPYSYYGGMSIITDFVIADDTITVPASRFGGGELSANTTITAAQFRIGSAAADASDRFIYNQNTGTLFYDYDGTGTNEQTQLVTLSPGLAMTNNDILFTIT